jgi:hypothetical protein
LSRPELVQIDPHLEKVVAQVITTFNVFAAEVFLLMCQLDALAPETHGVVHSTFDN